MNEVIQALFERRSIRKFKPDLPTKEDLEQIVKAGLYAPSGRGTQSPIIVAVTNKELRDKLSESNRAIAGMPEGMDPFYGAPAVLIVLVPKDAPLGTYDGSLAMGNMLLAAYALGLGSVWVHRAEEEFEQPEYQAVLKKLGIEGEWKGIGHCAVGYADCEAPEAAVRKENRAFWAE